MVGRDNSNSGRRSDYLDKFLMANEIRIIFPSGNTLYAFAKNRSGQIWYDGAFEDYGTSSRTANDYAVTMVDKSGNFYVGDFPEDISVGDYITQINLQAGASPADSDNPVGGDDISWTGIAEEVAAVAEVGAVDICNYGFAKLGGAEESIEIFSLTDGSENAALCSWLYPMVRNEVLQRWPFSSTKKFADLGAALTGDSLPEDADWDYVFNLPSDCVAVINQISEDARTTTYEYDVKIGKLFTNDLTNTDEDSAYIEYVFKQKDASKYSPSLINAIATKLAAEMAPRLKRQEYREDLLKEYGGILFQAECLNQLGLYEKGEEGEYTWQTARG